MGNTLFVKKEKSFLLIIIILFLLNFFSNVIYPTLISLDKRPIPVSQVTVEFNRTTQFNETTVLPPPPGEIFSRTIEDFFNYYLKLTLIGMYLFPHLNIIWIAALISLFVTIKYSDGIIIWRRVIYVYLVTTLISGIGATYWAGG